jgi:Calcineurin-like phosphoesterase
VKQCAPRLPGHNIGVKIQLLSDLHLETHPHFVPRPAPGADVLVLAGDIGSYQPGTMLVDDDFGLARFSPLQGWPTPVLFIPGNHEYDALDWDATHTRLRETCERLGITWLERETLVLGGVRFVGTTLWSDFEVLIDPADPTSVAMKKRDKAYRAANFYLHKAATLRRGELLLAEQVRELALECQAWLRQALAQPFAGPTVAVTHFAPSLLSGDPRYGRNPGTAGFCNALDDLLPLARLWLHGHLHCRHDYVAQGCRVVCQPLGYARKGEQEGFNDRFVIDLL